MLIAIPKIGDALYAKNRWLHLANRLLHRMRSHGRYKHWPPFHAGRKTDDTMCGPVGHRAPGKGRFAAWSHGCADTGVAR
ncbi:hypothetical protein [Bradyrhizobium sp. AS23.2]|uniref:hypothetical protein n=1 Tax=Bradyrhizobium sp. AS23.2 TaxID=1680155 RepID=UPI001160E9CD|nr:hypothetical protein [Bradyrhizobium sp. AS23.2]